MWAAEQGGPERSTIAMFLSPGASFDPDQHSDRTEPSDFQDRFTFTQRFLDEKKGDYWRLCAFEPSLHNLSVTDERTFVEKVSETYKSFKAFLYCMYFTTRLSEPFKILRFKLGLIANIGNIFN